MPDNQSKPLQVAVSLVSEAHGLVETVYSEKERRTALACFRDGRLTTHQEIDETGRGRLGPFKASNNLLTHRVVLFPSAAVDYSSEEALVNAVREFIHRYADLSAGFEEIATYYVLLTWVYDAFNEVPYLRLKGDFGSGKTRSLLTIGSLCYKSMFMSGASTVSPMFRIIDSFRGTLVLDESDFRFSDERAEIVKILNNGNARGFPVLRSESTPNKEFNPRAFDVFGPKIIASRSYFDDTALESRCITETLRGLPPRPDVPISLPSAFHEQAEELRNKLLMYRFRRLQTVRAMAVTVPAGIESRVAQIFVPLLAVVSSKSASDRILERARQHSGRLKAEREGSTTAQILDIMWMLRGEGVPLSIKDIALRFAERYGSDLDRPITPRWIGYQLRRIGITPVRRGGVFFVPESASHDLQVLFRRHGVGDIGDNSETSADVPQPASG